MGLTRFISAFCLGAMLVVSMFGICTRMAMASGMEGCEHTMYSGMSGGSLAVYYRLLWAQGENRQAYFLFETGCAYGVDLRVAAAMEDHMAA